VASQIDSAIDTVVTDEAAKLAGKCELRLLNDLKAPREIPSDGKNLIVLANIDDVLYIRVFDSAGSIIVDTDSERLTTDNPSTINGIVLGHRIGNLRKILKDLWSPHPLTQPEREQVLEGVTSIVGEQMGKPRGVQVEVRGQVPPMNQMFQGLGIGLVLAIVMVALLLTAYFQSVRLALVASATAPAVVAGVVLALYLTNTTLNIESFMGSIMAIGVAVANAILLVTFAERNRQTGLTSQESAVRGASERLRPILMTSCAMIAGMVPMALGYGEGGEQTASLGRAVIGGLLAATFATLLILPHVFAVVLGKSKAVSPSLHPMDKDSVHYDPTGGADTPSQHDAGGHDAHGPAERYTPPAGSEPPPTPEGVPPPSEGGPPH
jgi:hypothetical protein